VVSFNENSVNQLFEQAGLALWGSLRPQVLLWLIDEQGASRSIIAADTGTIAPPNSDGSDPTVIGINATIPSSVSHFSAQRGLPIIMPLMDLTDIQQVVLSDFWHYFPAQIQQASQRYFADTIVVMRVSDSSLLPESDADSEQSIDSVANSFADPTENVAPVVNTSCGLLCNEQDEQQEVQLPKVLDWRVYTQGALYTQQYQGIDKVMLINQGLSDITELIYQSYALLASAENDFIIEVQNVSSLISDTQLFDFLTELSAVKSVTLISAKGSTRRFKLDLLGSRASFLASIKLNDKLTQFVEPQHYDALDTESLVDEYISDEGRQVLDLEPDLSYQGKVIVLGEVKAPDEDNIATSSETNPDNNAAGELLIVDGNTKESNLADKNKNLMSTTVDGVIIEGAIGESATIKPGQEIIEVKPKLPLAPSIPVFYWEQG